MVRLGVTEGVFKWLPMGNKAAVNRLAEESGRTTGAKTKTGTPAVAEVPVSLDSSAGELLRADADEAELAVPGILAVVEEGQE